MGDKRLSDQIKNRWHEACFVRAVNPFTNAAGEKKEKKVWLPSAHTWMPLKSFVRKLVSEGDGMAKEWLNHKNGSLNLPRSEANIKAAREARAASKLARKSKKGGTSTPAKDAKGSKGKKDKGI